MRVEPLRGSLTVWLIRRAILDTGWWIRREQALLALRVHTRPSILLDLIDLTAHHEVVDVFECPCDTQVRPPLLAPPTPEQLSAPPTPERPKLELNWPSDNKRPDEAIIVRTVTHYETKTIAGSAFDLFI